MIARPSTTGAFLQSRIAVRVERVLRGLNEVPLPLAFVVLAVPVGTFLVFAQPPGQGLDESTHFYRVWTLAHGAIVAPSQHGKAGGYIPQCVLDYFQHFSAHASQRGPFSFSQYWQSPAGCSSKSLFTEFPGSAVYSPIPYIPSVLAVAMLRGIDAPLPVIFFGGRLVSLLAFIGLFYLAIRIAPIGKQVLFVLGLLPTTLLLASAYSADPMTIALAALSVGLTLRCCRSVEENRRAFYLLFLVLIGLALTKPTYFIFAFLIFMVPSRIMGQSRHPEFVRIVAAAVTLGLAGLWYVAVRNVQGAPVPLYRLNAHTQMRFIFNHPIGYLEVLARTFFESSGEQRWIPGFFFSVGYYRPFNADNIYAPIGLVIVGVLTLSYAYRLQFGSKRIVAQGTRITGWLPVGLSLIGLLLVETTLFLYGTPVGLPEVNTEGRYLYPLILLPLVTIGIFRNPRVTRHSLLLLLLGCIPMLIWLVLKIFVHDYTL